jgi:hypothetical protein
VCPSDYSCKTTVVGDAGPVRVSSLGHEIEPSACSSKRAACGVGFARVASWSKAKALSLDESRLKVGGGCGLGVGKGDGERKQGTQDIEKGSGLKKEGRCLCTGTPTLGLPPVFSGPVAVFMPCVYAVFDPMILHVDPWWVLLKPCNHSRTHGIERREDAGGLGGNRHTELCVLVRALFLLCR